MIMSRDYSLPTSLEHLSTEIFLQIFSSLPLRELVPTFFNLNSYIDSIIRFMRNVNHVVNYNDTKALNLLHLFPSQIGRLVIVNAESVDFTALINLRSLTLRYSSRAQFDSIRPQYFPMLEILHIYSSKPRKSLT